MTRSLVHTSPLHWLAVLALLAPAAASASEPSPALTVELGAAWQLRNTAQVSNEAPNTRFKIDELTGDGPYPAGRVVLDWPLNEKHRLRFLIAPLGIDESGTTSQPIVFRNTTFAPGPIDVKYRFDSYRASYRYVFYERERWTWSGGGTLNIRDAQIRLQQGALSRAKNNTGVVPLLALRALRPQPVRCPIPMRQDARNHPGILDARHDLQPRPATRTAFDLDAEHPLQTLRPAHRHMARQA